MIKTNSSTATVRTTVKCLFSEPEVCIVTDFLAVGTNYLSGAMSKNTGVSSMLPIKGNVYFPILKNFAQLELNGNILLSSCDGNLQHKDVLLQRDKPCL